MKALNLKAYNHFEFIDVPEPEPGEEDVLIGIKACGICGSDIHGMDGSSGRRLPPIIMGHEAAGVIARVGAAVEGWKPGDRVTFDSTIYCGTCPYCLQGEINLCAERRVLGVSCHEYRQNGAFAEYLKVPARVLYPLPDNLPFEQAAFAEPIAVALHAVGLMPVKPGDTAVVVGAGLIGLLVIQALAIAGAGRIVAVDLDQGRLKLAEQLGASLALRADDETVLDKIREATGGEGADLAMEVVGITPTLKLAVECLRKGGDAGLVGNLAAHTMFPLQAVVTRELTIHGSCGSAGEYPAALDHLASGRIRVEPLTSATAPLSEGAEWFSRLYENKEGLMKVLLRP